MLPFQAQAQYHRVMAKGKQRVPSGHVMKRAITDVKNSDGRSPPRPFLISGNDMEKGAKRKVSLIVKNRTDVLDVKSNMMRIQHNADPIGFMMEVMLGGMLPVHYIDDDGNVVTTYQQATIQQRLDISRFLANKVLPSMSLSKVIVDNKKNDGQVEDHRPGQPGAPTFAQIVASASARWDAHSGPRPEEVMDGVEISDDEISGQADEDGGGSDEGAEADQGDALLEDEPN